MYFHPLFTILISSALLIANYRNDKIFNFIAIVCPLIVIATIYQLTGIHYWDFDTFRVSADYSYNNKLISMAFALVITSANLYSISQNKKNELIIGTTYGGFSILAVMAADFISLFVAIEIMMIFSGALIFIGGHRKSIRAAKKYFLTHILSSNMIVIGIAYLITKNNHIDIIPLTNLIGNESYSQTILFIMFTGLIINIAVFPFSGWMANYYAQASASGFLYLITFTTKVSIFILIKLFPGSELLVYVSIAMILYAGFKALFENNLFSLLCYLSIIAMGFMLLGIAQGSVVALYAATNYLFIHILYKSLLSILVATLSDQSKIHLCTELKKISNKNIIIAFIVAIAVMINLPITPSFFNKIAISSFYLSSPVYYLIIIVGILNAASVPWRRYFSAKDSITLNLNFYNKASIYLILTSIIASFFYIADASLNSIFSAHALKQVVIIIAGIILCILLKKSRKTGASLNLIELIANIFFYFYNRWKHKENHAVIEESWSVGSLEKQILGKISKIHNQQTAIFIVFLLFIALLLTMIYSNFS